MSKPTKATKFIHAAADRARAGGVTSGMAAVPVLAVAGAFLGAALIDA